MDMPSQSLNSGIGTFSVEAQVAEQILIGANFKYYAFLVVLTIAHLTEVAVIEVVFGSRETIIKFKTSKRSYTT